jgi:hypothetical protein
VYFGVGAWYYLWPNGPSVLCAGCISADGWAVGLFRNQEAASLGQPEGIAGGTFLSDSVLDAESEDPRGPVLFKEAYRDNKGSGFVLLIGYWRSRTVYQIVSGLCWRSSNRCGRRLRRLIGST